MASRPKIGYVSLFHPPLGGGAEIYLERLTRSLRGFAQALWTLGPEIDDEASGPPEEMSVEYFARCPPIDYRILGDWFAERHERIFDSIRRWADRSAVDVVVLNSPISYFPPAKRLIRDLRRERPVGCLLHDVPGPSFTALLDSYSRTHDWTRSLRLARTELDRIVRSAEPLVYESPFHLDTDFTIYNSRWIRQFFDPRSERRNIVVHPLVHRTDDRPELGLGPVDLTIVNPLPMKGGALFLALANFHFRDRRIRILAGGYDSAMTHLEPFLRPVQSGPYRSEIPDHIEVLGRVQNMTEVYRSTSVLLHPTRIDSFGLAASEALFENCLVVTTDLPGVVEGVGDAALRMPYFATPQEWADGIAEMVEDRDGWQVATTRRSQRLLTRQAEEIAALEGFLAAIARA